MKKVIVLLLFAVLLSGCATTKWECQVGSCITKDQAHNKCLAQANAGHGNKEIVWSQCMRGEGFKEVRCADYEKDNPDCKIMHVW